MEHNFEANFFTLLELLDLESRLEIEGTCTRKSAQNQEIIITQGGETHMVYVVVEGVVEVLTHSPDGQQTRSVAFLGRGDFFGDSAALTGHPCLATVRACEETQLLQIEKMAFLALLEKIPKMGAYFSRNLARRFYETATEAHVTVYSHDLTGNLRHFDLPTIFQAITRMGSSGELQLNNSANELIGSFFFHEGRPEHARFVHLEGIEAIWEGFVQSGTDGTFTFQVGDQPAVPFNEEYRIELAGDDLLTQGILRRNAYCALPEPLRQMEGSLGRLTESLAWTEPETQDLAGHIWELIAQHPQPLPSLWRRLNYSAPTFLEAVNRLVSTGHAELVATAPPENSPAL
jgi:CRP-like cAMP-binding protein